MLYENAQELCDHFRHLASAIRHPFGNGGRRTEDGGQKAEDGGLGAEVGSRRSAVGRQWPVDGGRESEADRPQTTGNRQPLSHDRFVDHQFKDYQPEAVMKKYPHVVSVIEGVESVSQELSQEKIALFWIVPSWILLGVKEGNPCRTDKSH